MDGVCHTAYADNEQQQSKVTYPVCQPEWVASDLFSEREEKLQKRWEKRQKKMVEIGCSLFLALSASYSDKSQR